MLLCRLHRSAVKTLEIAQRAKVFCYFYSYLNVSRALRRYRCSHWQSAGKLFTAHSLERATQTDSRRAVLRLKMSRAERREEKRRDVTRGRARDPWVHCNVTRAHLALSTRLLYDGTGHENLLIFKENSTHPIYKTVLLYFYTKRK